MSQHREENKSGFEILFDPALNKGTAFTEEERDRLKIRGLLPPRVTSLDLQVDRTLENLRRKTSDIEKYIFLNSLHGRNERLFYTVVRRNLEEMLPLIYTPTVGQACREFAHIFRQTRGMYISAKDRGRVAALLEHWPEEDVRVVVVTDGQRVLGLGDLGANGMGIPLGKLQLYVACAGVPPHNCLPIMLDVGTNNEALRNDPLYLGLDQPRIAQDPYDELMEEVMGALRSRFPKVLVQFEDFLTPNAFRLLSRYRDRHLCFNDDIQGTAAVALAGVLASTRLTHIPFRELRFVFLGAGSAATGIADLICFALQQEGLSLDEARGQIRFVDVHGLVRQGRDDLLPHNLPYAHNEPPASFVETIHRFRPNVLIGATGVAGTFTREAVAAMAELNQRPVIFALSNPTSQAECTPQQAYNWSDGRAIVATGSPFRPVLYQGRTYHPGQGNNAYVFPGMGLGALVAEASRITDQMFLEAARCLAEQVTDEDLENGAVYPPITAIVPVSTRIAEAVASSAWDLGFANAPRPDSIPQAIEAFQYQPAY